MLALIQRFLNVRREEIAPLLASAFFFFCVLTAIMGLRPVRDSLGTTRGMDGVRWLFVGTAMATLVVNPIFGWLVSRFRRITFITATYVFFAVSLVGFYLLLTIAPQTVGETSGRVYYIWHSVFNLFCTAVFWSLMADQFTLEQSKRLFGVIAVGGTLGAIAGPGLAGALVEPLGTPALLLVSAVFLVAAAAAARLVSWLQPEQRMEIANEAAKDGTVIGGSAWEGLAAVFKSPYLLGIAAYILLTSVAMTYVYFTRIQIVQELGGDTNQPAPGLCALGPDHAGSNTCAATYRVGSLHEAIWRFRRLDGVADRSFARISWPGRRRFIRRTGRLRIHRQGSALRVHAASSADTLHGRQPRR